MNATSWSLRIGHPSSLRGFGARWPTMKSSRIAAVSDDPNVVAIGIDLEPTTPLASDLAGLILRPDEDVLDAHLAFTLKEAAYKAWSTMGGRLLDHADVRLNVAPDTFGAEVVPDGVTLTGRWGAAAGRWIALVVVRDRLEGAGLASG